MGLAVLFTVTTNVVTVMMLLVIVPTVMLDIAVHLVTKVSNLVAVNEIQLRYILISTYYYAQVFREANQRMN